MEQASMLLVLYRKNRYRRARGFVKSASLFKESSTKPVVEDGEVTKTHHNGIPSAFITPARSPTKPISTLRSAWDERGSLVGQARGVIRMGWTCFVHQCFSAKHLENASRPPNDWPLGRLDDPKTPNERNPPKHHASSLHRGL